MKKLSLILLSALTFCFTSCDDTTAQNRVNVTRTPPSNIAVQAENIPGFNVQNFADLLKTTKDPGAIEQAINAPNNTINNLDLNNDGNIDYLKVIESANNTLTVVDETSASASVTVATLTVNPQTQTMTVAGNQAYCGTNYIYTSRYSVGDYLFMAYLLQPHRYYVPVYRYGYYPSYYRPYRSVYGYGYSRPYYRPSVTRTTTTYRTTITPRSSNSYRTSTAAPRQSYTAPSRTSVSQPRQSQRSFQVRQSAPVRSGGFGSSRSSYGGSSSRSSFSRPSSSSSSRSSFSRPSSSSSSRSSFGGSRSSFGGGRRR